SEADAEARYLRVNDGLCRMVGLQKEQLVGSTFLSITYPEDAVEDRDLYARQVRGEIDRYTVEKRYVRADGSLLWVSVLSSTVRSENGGFLYSVRVAHDIDERKRAEERQRVLINELNHRVKNTL